jgi:hypothetical protein
VVPLLRCRTVVVGLAVPLRMRDVIALFTFVIALAAAVAALPVITSLMNLRIVLRHDISAILYSIIKINYFSNYQIKIKMSELISVEGIILPNQPLTDIQIIDAVNKLKIPQFRGVFCRDELPHKVNVNECGVINLDDSRGMGTHWCCWFKRDRDKYYFDSYGLQPPNELFNI